jgi:hypothetical protein
MRTYDYNTTIEVDIDDILDDMSEEEIIELFEDRIGKKVHGSETWLNIYDARRTLSEDAFLTYIDEVIMDATGRIL